MSAVNAVQLRLFPAPKPLVERLGAEFFKRVPRQPGVYLMSGEGERLLYVGTAKNLRQRLTSYRSVQPERASRKVIRLVHQVRAITWEVCRSPQMAMLRENELLRLHKPKFNVLNTRPEHYVFVGFKVIDATLSLRLTKVPARQEGEQLFGAFKGLGRIRAARVALLRLLWCADRQPASLYELPSALFQEKPPELCHVALHRLDWSALPELMRNFLAGEDDGLLQFLSAGLLARETVPACFRPLHEQDTEALRMFFRFGPARNRALRERCAFDRELVAQSELDDLLVLAGRRTREQSLDSIRTD